VRTRGTCIAQWYVSYNHGWIGYDYSEGEDDDYDFAAGDGFGCHRGSCGNLACRAFLTFSLDAAIFFLDLDAPPLRAIFERCSARVIGSFVNV